MNSKKLAVIVLGMVGLTLVLFVVALGSMPSRLLPHLGKTIVTSLMGPVVAILVGTLVAIAIGSEKVPEPFKKPATIVASGMVIVGLLLGIVFLNVGTEEAERRLTPEPAEVEIAMRASAKGAAEQYLGVLYDHEKWRQAFSTTLDAQALMVESKPIAESELQIALATMPFTPTKIITEPVMYLEYLRTAEHYSVQFLGTDEGDYLGGYEASPTLHIEVFVLPPMRITDGDAAEIANQRIVWVLLHRIPTELGEIARDLYLVAAVIFQ
jgi:hypothetical protein